MNQPIFKNVCVGFGGWGVEEVIKYLPKFTRKKRRTSISKNGGWGGGGGGSCHTLPPLWPNSGSGWKCNMCRLD